MSFAFFGTPEFSKIVLEILIQKGFTPSLVVTSPDKPVGRKQILTPSPVKQFAIEKGLQVESPKNKNEIISAMEQWNNGTMEFGILAAYGIILPTSIINAFPHGILNLHPSLLPKYRGSSPIQSAILNGDKETGVTIIKLNEKIDEGEIVAHEKIPILPNDTTLTLGKKLFAAGTNLLIKILPNYLEGKIKTKSQTSLVRAGLSTSPMGRVEKTSPTKNTKKFTKNDGFISPEDLKNIHDNLLLSRQIYNKFRAFQPWPGIWTTLPNGKRMLITKCHLENEVLKIDFVKVEGKQEEKFIKF